MQSIRGEWLSSSINNSNFPTRVVFSCFLILSLFTEACGYDDSLLDLKPNFSGPPPSSMAAGPDAYLQGNIRMTLEDPELWKSFHEIGTEMIITKPGR